METPRWIRRLFGADVSKQQLAALQQQRADKRGISKALARDKATRKRRAARKSARAHKQLLRRRSK